MVADPSLGQLHRQPRTETHRDSWISFLSILQKQDHEVFLANLTGTVEFTDSIGLARLLHYTKKKGQTSGLEACWGAEGQVPRAHWKEQVRKPACDLMVTCGSLLDRNAQATADPNFKECGLRWLLKSGGSVS